MQKISLRPLFSALLLASAMPLAHAQSTPAAAPPSAAKKELIGRLLKIQRPGIEAMARDMVQEPAVQMLDRAASVIQARVAPEQREGVIKGLQTDAKSYMDQTVPVVRDRAVALAPDTVGAVIDQKFSEDELKKIIGILESPEYAKFQQASAEMQQSLQAKLVSETRSSVEEKVKGLESALTARLKAALDQPSSAAPAATPAKPTPSKAAKPAGK